MRTDPATTLPEPLPREPGYETLLGVGGPVLSELRELHRAALEGEIGAVPEWRRRHAGLLGGRLSVGQEELAALTETVSRLVRDWNFTDRASDDELDDYLFAARLRADLVLLRTPEPRRELAEREELLPRVGPEDEPALLLEVRVLRGLLGETDPEVYEAHTRMRKAMTAATLEHLQHWLRTALAEEPGLSGQELLARASAESAAAAAELRRYDRLRPERRGPRH